MTNEILPLGSPLTLVQVALIEAALIESQAPNTRRTYRSAMRGFVVWCQANGQPSLPTNPAVCAAFLVELAESKSMSTITVTVAAIRDAHLSGGHRDPTDSRGVKTTMAGLRRRLGTAPLHQARAFDVPELKRILAPIDRETVAGKRDAALILLAFASAMRRSELVALTRADLHLSPEGIRISIRRSKADQDGAGAVIGVPAGRHAATDPLRALRQWLGVRGESKSDLVFARVSRTGVVLAGGLTGQSVNAILQSRSAAAGVELDGLSAHSTRASHITQASKAGVPIEQIMRTSRHASVAVALGYIRGATAIQDSSAGSLGL
ncbi:site-specific integrase [Cryobacterium sp. GrIS_2_6]|uniref:site-specific integrase n=1 Tax=Cryobacterium sp. GrIS_2_6 TaxID=3162785 RepID=UPI002E0751B7|nr:integrase [Cryobacterium psychrotolerans]